MAEQQDNGQERTEEPTPKRLREAREKGQVARSRELTMTAVMLAGSGLLLLYGPGLAHSAGLLLEDALTIERQNVFDDRFMASEILGQAGAALALIAPLLLVLAVVALLSSGLLGGFSFSRKAMAPKLDRLDPAKGLKRVFGSKGLMELLKAMAKFIVVAAGGLVFIWLSIEKVVGLSRMQIISGIGESALLVSTALFVASAVLIFIAAIDVPFQLYTHHKQLRMTRQEVREELKQTEGRPEVKSKLRNLQQQRAGRRMMQAVPDADVVINNPTHFSIALRYDAETMDAPRVIAKGKDELALSIRKIASAHEVPQVEAPMLARTLYSGVELGQAIPSRLYSAVAEILAWVHRIRNVAPGEPLPPPPAPMPDEPAEMDS